MESVPSKINPLMIIKDVQFGLMDSVLNALKDGTSTNKKIAHPSVISALHGMILEPALNATTDTLSAKVNVLLMMTEALFPIAISSVKHGLHKNAQNVLREHISMLMVFAAQLAHNATLLTRQLEHVLAVIKDMMLLMETVLTHHPIEENLQILDVEIGIGKIKNVSLAQRNGPLMQIIFVYQYLTNVDQKMKKEIA